MDRVVVFLKLFLPLLVVALAAVPVHADPLPPVAPAPGNFHASLDERNGTVHLSWTAPGNETYNYTLKRDGQPLAVLTQTTYTDQDSATPFTVYELTAAHGGQESYPVALLIIGGTSVCWPVSIVVGTTWPYADWGINPECIPPIVPSPPNLSDRVRYILPHLR